MKNQIRKHREKMEARSDTVSVRNTAFYEVKDDRERVEVCKFKDYKK